AGIWWLSSRRGQQHAQQPVANPPAETRPAQPPPAQPTAQPAMPQNLQPLTATGGAAALTQTLDGNQPLPARFVVSDLRFRQDSADIDPSTARVLDDVAGVLQTHPSAKIRVEGNTDTTGNLAKNMTLSQQRANAVKTYLGTMGVAPDRVEAVGYGST